MAVPYGQPDHDLHRTSELRPHRLSEYLATRGQRQQYETVATLSDALELATNRLLDRVFKRRNLRGGDGRNSRRRGTRGRGSRRPSREQRIGLCARSSGRRQKPGEQAGHRSDDESRKSSADSHMGSLHHRTAVRRIRRLSHTTLSAPNGLRRRKTRGGWLSPDDSPAPRDKVAVHGQ
jgi:hypothetical protein